VDGSGSGGGSGWVVVCQKAVQCVRWQWMRGSGSGCYPLVGGWCTGGSGTVCSGSGWQCAVAVCSGSGVVGGWAWQWMAMAVCSGRV
jgi:hypothetical protein